MRPGDTLKQPFPYSLPKDKIKILLLEGISETAVGLFKAAAYSQIDRRTKALDAAELRKALDGGVRMLGIRSRTQLTADVLVRDLPRDHGSDGSVLLRGRTVRVERGEGRELLRCRRETFDAGIALVV